jgi:Fic family protein
MNIKEFIAGSFSKEFEYKAFLPNEINKNWIWDDSEINILLDEANRKIGEINAFSVLIPDIDLFIKMHIVKEANTSSKIEGTKTKFDEALMKESEILPERRDDWKEVHQYIEAMNKAIELLKELPLSNRLIKETHKILLKTGRGKNKTPGEFRKSQNWIGGNNLATAKFIPPHNKYLDDLMSDLEKFINNFESNIPHLIKVALMHYQFETIHPFLDGNGRIGRLLITLYLVGNNILNKPALYLSDYLEKNRNEYYLNLTKVREENDLITWIKFFLKGVIITADKTKKTFIDIIELKNEMNELLHKYGSRSEKINLIINKLYEIPIMSIKEIVKATGISDKTVRNLIEIMEKDFIIKEITGHERNKMYVLEKYLKIFL